MPDKFHFFPPRSADVFRNCLIILKSDSRDTIASIAEDLGCGTDTVIRVRRLYRKGGVAKLLKRGVARPVKQPQDRFTWVVVHAWSRFKSAKAGGKPLQVSDAAKTCIGGLGHGIKVVTPEALATLLDKAHGKKNTGKRQRDPVGRIDK